MGKGKFYSLIFTLVIVTIIVIGGLCAWTILGPRMFSDAKGVDEITDSPQKKNVMIEIIRDKFSDGDETEAVQDDIPINIAKQDDGEVTPVGALVWPLKELELYSDVPSGGNTKELLITKVKKGSALVVDSNKDDYFYVNYNGEAGYIDGRYCLINLPDYLGDMLEYNITNSYSSIFMAHDYKLYGITDTVLTGYENVAMGDGEYLVPYLYPCANKLKVVAERVLNDGYKLKIYDAFRPYNATRFLYDTVNSYINLPVPDKDAEGNEIVEFDEDGMPLFLKASYPPVGSVIAFDGSIRLNDLTTIVAPPGTVTEYPVGSMIVENGAVIDPNGTVLGVITLPAEQTTQVDPVTGLPATADSGTAGTATTEMRAVATPSSGMTYQMVITGGTYNLGAFLAKVSSAHNKGIALDLTLCDKETGQDVEMQTAMHDLSYNSVISKNNDNAKLLAKYMKEGGFNDLTSEWWHFQDDDTRHKLGINFLLEEGVSP